MLDFKNKFRIDNLLIEVVGSWTISLRPVQVTIGSLVLSLNRKCQYLHELTPEEGQELVLAFKVIEALYAKTLQPDKVNYLALMMVDHQVHFHVVPRYEKPISLCDETYVDSNWPGPPDILSTIILSDAQLQALLVELRKVQYK